MNLEYPDLKSFSKASDSDDSMDMKIWIQNPFWIQKSVSFILIF